MKLLLTFNIALVLLTGSPVHGADYTIINANSLVKVGFYSGSDSTCAEDPPQLAEFDLCCPCFKLNDVKGVPTGIANFDFLAGNGRLEWNSFPENPECVEDAGGNMPLKFANAECSVQTDGAAYRTWILNVTDREGTCEQLEAGGKVNCEQGQFPDEPFSAEHTDLGGSGSNPQSKPPNGSTPPTDAPNPASADSVNADASGGTTIKPFGVVVFVFFTSLMLGN